MKKELLGLLIGCAVAGSAKAQQITFEFENKSTGQIEIAVGIIAMRGSRVTAAGPGSGYLKLAPGASGTLKAVYNANGMEIASEKGTDIITFATNIVSKPDCFNIDNKNVCQYPRPDLPGRTKYRIWPAPAERGFNYDVQPYR